MPISLAAIGRDQRIFFLSDGVFDSLRYAQVWFNPELGTQIGLDKYYNDKSSFLFQIPK